MLKQYVRKIILFTSLMAGLGGTAAAPAWATTDPIWSGNVRQAVTSNQAVKDGLLAYSDDCQSLRKLKRLLDLGANLSAANASGELGELRTHFVSLELMTSVAQLASQTAPSPESLGTYATVMGLRNEAFELLEQHMGMCGNGVERESAR
jgi:hypothetical protein